MAGHPQIRLSRRAMFRGAGALGLGTLLAACGGERAGDPGTTAGSPSADPAQAALAAAGVDAPLELTPLIATFEVLTGGGSRVQFGVLDQDNAPLLDADLTAYIVRAEDGEVVQGPVAPTFHGEGLGVRGVYVIEADLQQPGIHDLVVVTADGRRAGTGALRVLRPEDSAVITPGEPFPSVDTPTVDDPKDLAELCTREPDCDMHGVSLEDALAAGDPIVLTVATPKYCQTAVCGPVVDVVLEVRDRIGRDDVTFIHAEVFSDAGNTPTEVVTALGLPTEPWTFLIAADGTLADRFDGPVVPDLLERSIDEHL